MLHKFWDRTWNFMCAKKVMCSLSVVLRSCRVWRIMELSSIKEIFGLTSGQWMPGNSLFRPSSHPVLKFDVIQGVKLVRPDWPNSARDFRQIRRSRRRSWVHAFVDGCAGFVWICGFGCYPQSPSFCESVSGSGNLSSRKGKPCRFPSIETLGQTNPYAVQSHDAPLINCNLQIP